MMLRAARHFFNVEKTSKKRKATSWQRTFTYLNDSHVKSGSFPTMRGYLGDATTNIHVGICWYVIYIYYIRIYVCSIIRSLYCHMIRIFSPSAPSLFHVIFVFFFHHLVHCVLAGQGKILLGRMCQGRILLGFPHPKTR